MPMKTPPKMLSPKDVSYISDICNTILTLAKKAKDYAKHIEDEVICQHVQDHAHELEQQYNELLAIMKEETA